VATAACVPPMIGWTDQQNYVWKNASATFQCEPFQTPGSSVRLFVCLSVCLSVRSLGMSVLCGIFKYADRINTKYAAENM